MSFIEVIPQELRKKEMLGAVVEYIRLYPAPAKYRKYMLVDYAKFVGLELTKDMVDAAGVADTE